MGRLCADVVPGAVAAGATAIGAFTGTVAATGFVDVTGARVVAAAFETPVLLKWLWCGTAEDPLRCKLDIKRKAVERVNLTT